MKEQNLIKIYRLCLLITFSMILVFGFSIFYLNSILSTGHQVLGCSVIYPPEYTRGIFDSDCDSCNNAGRNLFIENCSACHLISKHKVGPPLAGLSGRRTKKWIHSFIKSPQKLFLSKDTATASLFKKYSPMVMPDHDFLTDAQIDSIVDYLDRVSQ